MRLAALMLSLLFVASITVARADITNSAPADEYFGPSKQSVLEIRNRLNDYDQRDPGAMLDPEVTSSLDHLQAAILDWQHQYPRDPWLPAMFSHLMREYWRAGQASSENGMAALGGDARRLSRLARDALDRRNGLRLEPDPRRNCEG